MGVPVATDSVAVKYPPAPPPPPARPPLPPPATTKYSTVIGFPDKITDKLAELNLALTFLKFLAVWRLVDINKSLSQKR
jgi:hypothetical protein